MAKQSAAPSEDIPLAIDDEQSVRKADAWKTRDHRARMLHLMVRWRSRLPRWHEEAMGVLAAAEAGGVRVLEAAVPAISDAKLRRIMLKHIEDEKRHTQGFTDFANQMTPDKPIPVYPAQPSQTTVLDFFAFLEITELRGEQMIGNYRTLYEGYPEVQAFMDTVMRDEKYHANYLHVQLDNWAREGNQVEVARARQIARRIDGRGFRAQVVAFIKVIPRLLAYELRSLMTPSRQRNPQA
jgi:rubrerythrin